MVMFEGNIGVGDVFMGKTGERQLHIQEGDNMLI